MPEGVRARLDFYTPPQYLRPTVGGSVRVQRSMPHSAEDKRSAIRRLRRIAGQAQALERAIDEGCECNSALQQLAALRGAVNSLMAEVLESHLKETFGRTAPARVTAPQELDATIDQAVSLVRSYLR
jgi:FrmR/RcnR family transcriptional regulator, repressor of frmRAB operon